ncbi:hypothetical protein [Mycobacterium asiaticum]|uniref:HicB family protein n=1 Tax=Mycobacterium asiaticum TaxID=1790 RepID=A0A1A3L2S4_MYCAS|nr:hypothetical protein [Mycobacterium asiaticum]OBJ90908.1 hypothetical protein A5640_02105 [Mycobacterium asiaticum]
MRCYEIEVTRDGSWWMINIPEIDGLTQARNASEIEQVARSYIAVATDRTTDDIAVITRL